MSDESSNPRLCHQCTQSRRSQTERHGELVSKGNENAQLIENVRLKEQLEAAIQIANMRGVSAFDAEQTAKELREKNAQLMASIVSCEKAATAKVLAFRQLLREAREIIDAFAEDVCACEGGDGYSELPFLCGVHKTLYKIKDALGEGEK